MGKSYAITVYADAGPETARERALVAVRTLRNPGSASALLGQNGHVFVLLTDGHISTCVGFYGRPACQGGPIRIEPYLAERGWSVKKTFPISQPGYHAAFQVIEKWNTDGKQWALKHNCGDFAEAVLRAAGINLSGLKQGFAGHRPGLWADYLRTHGGYERH